MQWADALPALREARSGVHLRAELLQLQFQGLGVCLVHAAEAFLTV